MKSRTLTFLALLALLPVLTACGEKGTPTASATPTAAEQESTATPTEIVPEATAPVEQGDDPFTYPMNVMQDEGRFTYYVNEEAIGASFSKWNVDGSFENYNTIELAGQEIEDALKIQVDEDGRWTSMIVSTARGLLKIGRTGASATIEVGGKTSSLNLKPGTLLMEGLSPALLSQAVVAYDRAKGGQQSFPLVFILDSITIDANNLNNYPATVTEALLEYVDTFERRIGERKQTFSKYHYLMPPLLDAYVTVDEQNRVCLAEYPIQHSVFIRQGYDALNVQDASDPLLSQPEYEVVLDRNVGVPMRDGIELATDIYHPDKPGPSPVILVRTPSKRR